MLGSFGGRTVHRSLAPAGLFAAALIVRLAAFRATYPEQFFFGKYLLLGEALRDSGWIAERPFSYAPIYTCG